MELVTISYGIDRQMSFTVVPIFVLTLSRTNVKTSSHRRCSIKKGVLKISEISRENTCPGDCFWLKCSEMMPKKVISWNFKDK